LSATQFGHVLKKGRSLVDLPDDMKGVDELYGSLVSSERAHARNAAGVPTTAAESADAKKYTDDELEKMVKGKKFDAQVRSVVVQLCPAPAVSVQGAYVGCCHALLIHWISSVCRMRTSK
jgi:hypothetical protein